jgi:putative membrane protein
MHGLWMHGPYYGSWFGMIPMVLFWAFLIVVAVLLVRRVSGRGSSGGAESPLDVAKKRYARGEIDKAQFEQLKKDLSEP